MLIAILITSLLMSLWIVSLRNLQALIHLRRLSNHRHLLISLNIQMMRYVSQALDPDTCRGKQSSHYLIRLFTRQRVRPK